VVTDATHLTATLTITPTAALGASNVTVTTGSEVATGSNLFTVTAGTPVVLSLILRAGPRYGATGVVSPAVNAFHVGYSFGDVQQPRE